MMRALTLAVLFALAGCSPKSSGTRLLVLGVDGMDPAFVREHFDKLPNLRALAKHGDFRDLETTMPPQSPVAWSTVITGMTPGGHGVFDFVHRRPNDVTPFSSMAEARPPDLVLNVGNYVIPLTGGETVPLRKGRAFWEILAEHDVPSEMIRMPTDFPPLDAATKAISGMGTPDMLGSFGTFQYYTDDPDEYVRAEVSGGEIVELHFEDDIVWTDIEGPVNSFLKDAPRSAAVMTIERDPQHPTARIQIGDEVVVLEQGDWSDWVRVEFELIPWMKSATGIVRLFLREVRPNFKLYISPVNIDPAAPEVPISHPDDFAAEAAEAVGPFYTQGMAEETKALSAHLITRDDFVNQASLVFEESIDLYEHEFERWDDGLLFYYFSTIDQSSHMLWGAYADKLLPLYQRMDEVVGWTLERLPGNITLLVISDHGFERFDREVHLNRWLMDEGFLVLDDPSNVGFTPGFVHVDWSKTKAYAMGLNGLYINKIGREAEGIVSEDAVPALLKSLEAALMDLEDPDSGELVVERLYDPHEVFEGEEFEFAPDLLVGFAPPYRMSPETGLGAVPSLVLEDNDDEWVGDHCMAHDTVPGVIFTNRKIAADKPRLHDVPVTILQAFDVPAPSNMVGTNVIADR